MVRSLDVLLLLAISLVYVSIVQAGRFTWAPRCCSKGQRKARQSNDPTSCNSDDLDRRRFNTRLERLICRHAERICCVKEIQKISCQSGKYEASQNNSCNEFRPFVGGDDFRECCDCCALGIKAKKENDVTCSLDLFPSMSPLCGNAFKECCNGTVSWNGNVKIPKKPRCSDNFCKHECREIPNVGAKCFCRSGYQLQSDQVSCKDIDECQKHNSVCSPLQLCVNSPGSYKCVNENEAACSQGKEKQNGRCIDINECLRGIHRCGRGQTCVNNDGSYSCVCGSGFQAYGRSCLDKNECVTGEAQCPSGSTCINTEGSYRCQCESGRILRNNKCEDLDECSTGQHTCPTGTTCKNTDGYYECLRITQCPTGQELNSAGRCVDKKVDICARIQCAHGYVCDPNNPVRPCQDIDECTESPPRCKQSETCVNFLGTFECRDPCKDVDCGSGLKCEPLGRSYRCLDVDECRFAPRKCFGDHEICVNKHGGFECKCRAQFRRNLRTNQCERDSICGRVTCPSGYNCVVIDQHNFQCKDINECEGSQNACPPDQRCVNIPGGHYCACQDGYRKNITTNKCQDIDECKYGRCGQICVNTPGSYVCSCRKGYAMRLNGRYCADINECTNGTSGCSHYCDNTLGSYVCRCRRGYELRSDGKTCIDRNECNGVAKCAYRCLNTPGSYRCFCPRGYNSTGYYCSDYDECKDGDRCANDRYCFNTYGGFRCLPKIRCYENYVNTSDTKCDRKCAQGDLDCYRRNKVQSYSRWAFKLRSNDPPSTIFSYRIVTYGYREDHRPQVKFYFYDRNLKNSPGTSEHKELPNFTITTERESNNSVLAYIKNKKIKGPKLFNLEFRGDVIDSATGNLSSRFVIWMYVFVSPYEF